VTCQKVHRKPNLSFNVVHYLFFVEIFKIIHFMTIVGDDDEDVEMIQFKSFYIIRTFYLQFTKLQNTDAMLQMR